MINDPAQLTGMVLNGTHGIYDVYTDNGVLRCTLRGKLKKAFAQANSGRVTMNKAKSAQSSHASRSEQSDIARVERIERRDSSDKPLPTRLSVGDYVKIRKIDDSNGLIEEILPRKSELSRMDSGSNAHRQIQQTLLANLTQVIVVFATTQPEPHFGLLDRYLAICEAAHLSPSICINKADLEHPSTVEETCELYRHLGYRVLFTSTQTVQGIEELRVLLKDQVTLFTGPSGVGKSSLVNALEPGMAVRTGMVSDATGKGRHTTTGSQLYPLSEGGWLADSAGIRALTAWNIEPEELASCFVEFRPFLDQCAFDDCMHIDEEGCAVIEACENGQIDEERYRSYVRMYTAEER